MFCEDLSVNEMIFLNGELKPLSASSLDKLIEENGIDASKGGVAVALNGEVVPRSIWDQTPMKPNDKIEIVQIVRGG